MERKLVTILFEAAIGSTSLGDRLDPERLRAVLDAYFATMSAAVQAWGGTVEKFIGDAVMAVFGYRRCAKTTPSAHSTPRWK